MKNVFLSLFLLVFLMNGQVQGQTQGQTRGSAPTGFSAAYLFVPLSLIGAGAIMTAGGNLNQSVEDKFAEHRGRPYKFDDVLMYVPSAMVYGFSLFAEPKHDWWDRSMILGTSATFVLSTLIVKQVIDHQRPDGSKNTSFPSGHTAVAFVGAEIVRREYPAWCGAIAYSMAGTVAFMRLYNKRHWVGDVVAGAGFGILSVSAAYWLLPVQQRIMSRSRFRSRETAVAVNPYFDNEKIGLFLTFSPR
ncbi:MAG: phosphatase PAP2 family protein [Chitinivibrionia bacterium]|nr:phosphatase PAP2 family protein [Chitinivibrionia bacterium]